MFALGTAVGPALFRRTLDRATNAPPKGLEDFMRTFGDAFHIVALHHMSHRGQLADARQALGRKPIF